MTGATGFEAVAMPVALKKKMGLTAMKVFAQEKLLGKASPEMLLRYCMSLPVAATTIGMPELAHIDFNSTWRRISSRSAGRDARAADQGIGGDAGFARQLLRRSRGLLSAVSVPAGS